MRILRYIIAWRGVLASVREEECRLILNALEVLRRQRIVALTTFGASDPHLDELDDEHSALLMRARALRAAWA